MSSIIVKSGVAGKIPLPKDLEFGQLAVNYTDEKIYFKNIYGNIIEVNPNVQSSQTFEFQQSIPQDTWSIAHTLNKYPSVTVVDSSGSEVEGEVVYINSTTLEVKFQASFSGKAYLN